MNKCYRLIVFVFSFCYSLASIAQDSISDANKKKIEELRERIDKLYEVEKNPDSLIMSLKEVIRQQRDSIQKLTVIVKEKTQLNPCNCTWIYYDMGKYRTDYSKYPDLDSIAAFLKKDPSLQVKLVGHADKTGTETVNQNLSLQRAKNLKEYLVSRYKLSSKKIIIEGRGSKEPIKGNADPNFFHIDRRVEVFLVQP